MVFPRGWVEVHPEFERIDVDHDFPDAYLPEFPPPMFLTTHKELGDVTGGREVTLGNYFEIFDGLLTGEQMEGLKELLRPTPTTWFNQTEHRVTARAERRRGVLLVPRQRAHQRRVRARARHRGPTRRACASTRRPCAATTT